jgi:acyl-CoA thioester hydrolase
LSGFRFSTPVVVRYSDVDAQGHVNNARYFTYMEEARLLYVQAIGLWEASQGFDAIGQIVAEATCTFLKPILLGQTVDVGLRIPRLGNKSLIMEYLLTVAGEEVATGRTVQVAYDYHTHQSIPIPEDWRKRIEAYESGAD